VGGFLIGSDVQNLVGLARNKTPSGREALATAIGSLIELGERQFTQQEIVLMGDILKKLIQDVAAPIRKLLSEKLARSGFAPPQIVEELANDEIDIATPVLLHSPVLSDEALIAIVRRRTRSHRLAVAMRRNVNTPVCEALVATNENDVIHALLSNHGARITQATLAYLTDQSRHVDEFREPLLRREDLPPQLAKKMYVWVSEALRSYIVANYKVDRHELDVMLAEATSEALERAVAATPAENPAVSVVNLLAQSSELRQDMVVQTLRRGEVALFDAMISQLVDLSPELASRLIYEEEAEGFAIACRAASFNRSTFTTLFLLLQRAGIRGLTDDPEQLRRGLELFDRLRPATATRAVRRFAGYPDFLRELRKQNRSADGNGR
jgi:uncharacterized protein (DUF2336 family)